MAKRPNINLIGAGYASKTLLNDNFTAIQEAFDNTLSLDGSAPNAMQGDLDMNSNAILNVGTFDVDSLTVNGQLVNDPASLFNYRSAWVTATVYAAYDVVTENGSSYVCLVNHTAGTFATDLADSKWGLLAQVGASGAGSGDLLAANNLSDVGNITTARNNLGAQAQDDVLDDLSGLTQAANKIPYFDSATTASTLDFKDEDDMTSDSATAIPSQQSVKAYVDASSPITTTTGSAPYYGVRAWGKVSFDSVVDGGNFASWDASTNTTTFTTAMPHANYAVVINGSSFGNAYAASMTTTGFNVQFRSSGGNSFDPTSFEFIVIC